MRRREFIAIAGGAAAWQVWRMGFIAHGRESFYDSLFEGLRDYGYVEGQNLVVERRYARGDAALFNEFAVEMVRLNVDVIVVVTTPAALAVKNATTTIPIVHPNAIDPLNTGLIASLAHPGGNLTGGAQLTAEASAKRLQILKKVVPRLSRGAALWTRTVCGTDKGVTFGSSAQAVVPAKERRMSPRMRFSMRGPRRRAFLISVRLLSGRSTVAARQGEQDVVQSLDTIR